MSDIRPLIHEIRGVQVILDRDLAFLYGVLTKNLNKAVKRNLERFPADFMFQLTKDEVLRFQIGTINDGENPLLIGATTDSRSLRFQNGTTKERRGGSRYAPYAFTENGIAMLSSVLHTERAIEVNIRIMREFVAMRKALASFGPVLSRIETVELAESDFAAFARQYGHFTKTLCGICHDRFIIVDRKELFLIGASLKDAGRLTFAAAKMGPEAIPGLIDSIRKATNVSHN